MFGLTIISKERLRELERIAINSTEDIYDEYTRAYNAGYEAGCQDTERKIRTEVRHILKE